MEKRPRGRPPHPDILTPREWEVLELLRRSLSNEAIAERLGISIAGVKFHVSEILSKLHVSSREEAAAWQPEERTRGAWLALPVAAKVVGVAVVAAAIAAVAVLAYGVSQTDGGDPNNVATNFDLDDLQLGEDPERDRLLLDVGIRGHMVKVDLQPAGGADFQNEFVFEPAEKLDQSIDAWLIRVTTWSETYPGFLSGPIGRPDPPPGCYQSTTWEREGQPVETSLLTSANRIELVDDSECDVESISRETAIAVAGKEEYRQDNAETSPPLVASSTLDAAVDALIDAGFTAEGLDTSPGKRVWLVVYNGPVVKPLVPTEAPVTPRPTPVPNCSRVATIVDATNGDVLLSEAMPLGPC